MHTRLHPHMKVGSGAPWEELVGYSRVVRVGPFVYVTGTVAQREGQVLGLGDMYLQTQACLEIILANLAKVGAAAEDVVRTRMYTIDIQRFEDIGRAHREVFAEIKPATTLVEVQRLIAPEYLIEIEVDAVMQAA